MPIVKEKAEKLIREINAIRAQILIGHKITTYIPTQEEALAEWNIRIILKNIIRKLRNKVLELPVQEARVYIKEAIDEETGDEILDFQDKVKLGKGLISEKDKMLITQTLIAGKIRAGTNAMEHVFRITGFPYTFTELQNKVKDVLEQKKFKIKTTEMTDTLERTLKNKLKQGYESGMSIKKIAQSLDELETNAKTIADTEINGIVQKGHFDAMMEVTEEVGVNTMKTWLHSHSDSPYNREEHMDMDGETVPIDEPFSNGLMFPHDPAGEAGDVINCHCDLKYSIKGKEE